MRRASIRGRKGDFWTTMWAFFKLPVIVIVAGLIVGIAFMFLREELDVSRTRAVIMSERLRTAPGSYVYEDPETGRTFPGTVDSRLFEQDVFERSFRYGNDTGARVCLSDGELRCRYVNRKRYDWWSPLVSYDQYLSLRRRTLANVVQGDELKREIMESEVVIKVE